MGEYIRDHRELKRIIEGERSKGKKIVFGNGCFDLLHVGHVRYLQGAKALGDVLVIALNDDASVVGLGKRKSVVTPLDERVEIIASIRFVDYVTTFSEPTVENLLRLLQPDFHAKGTDYTPETVPEKDDRACVRRRGSNRRRSERSFHARYHSTLKGCGRAMNLPLSVYMITLNNAATIEKALVSVHGWVDEIIVVDSDSTDGTPEIAQEIHGQLPPVHDNQPAGQVSARTGPVLVPMGALHRRR